MRGSDREIAPPVQMSENTLPYRAMAYNNGWANHRLLAACALLPESEFTAPRIGFFPTIRATLNHILIVDLFYVDAVLWRKRKKPRLSAVAIHSHIERNLVD